MRQKCSFSATEGGKAGADKVEQAASTTRRTAVLVTKTHCGFLHSAPSRSGRDDGESLGLAHVGVTGVTAAGIRLWSRAYKPVFGLVSDRSFHTEPTPRRSDVWQQ